MNVSRHRAQLSNQQGRHLLARGPALRSSRSEAGLVLRSSLSEGGFTLVEVMMASCIMLIALSAMMSTFIFCKKAAMRTEKHLVALHQGREHMERLWTHTFSDPELAPGLHYLSNATYLVTPGPHPTTKDIRLTVYWADRNTPTNVGITLCGTMSDGLH